MNTLDYEGDEGAELVELDSEELKLVGGGSNGVFLL